MSVVSISISREREVADRVEATVYLHRRQCSQLGMCTWGGGGALAGMGGRGGRMAAEVSTSLHVEELQEEFILTDSMDRYVKQLELGSGGVQSIHYGTKNPPVCPPHHSPSCPLPQGRVCLRHPW